MSEGSSVAFSYKMLKRILLHIFLKTVILNMHLHHYSPTFSYLHPLCFSNKHPNEP